MMKKTSQLAIVVLLCMVASVTMYSCKGKKKQTEDVTITPPPVTEPATPTPAPVEVSPDEALTKSVMDATKDFPTVQATVSGGVVTVTGDIKRADLQKLMIALNALHPKKIENKLTIK